MGYPHYGPQRLSLAFTLMGLVLSITHLLGIVIKDLQQVSQRSEFSWGKWRTYTFNVFEAFWRLLCSGRSNLGHDANERLRCGGGRSETTRGSATLSGAGRWAGSLHNPALPDSPVLSQASGSESGAPPHLYVPSRRLFEHKYTLPIEFVLAYIYIECDSKVNI